MYEQRDVPRLRRLVRLRVCCRLQRTILPDERRRLHSNVSHSAYLPISLSVLSCFTPTTVLGPDLLNILRQSYDNAEVTIDLQQSSTLQKILRTQGIF